MQQGIEPNQLQLAGSSEIMAVYSGPAVYIDKIYAAHDPVGKVVRMTFCESIQGAQAMEFRSAIMMTESGVDSMIKLLQDVQAKMKQGNITGTLQ
jgi:hypothetical protein